MRSNVVTKMGPHEVIATLNHPNSPLILEILKADGSVEINGQVYPNRRFAFAYKLGTNKARMTYFGFDYLEDMDLLRKEAVAWIEENKEKI